MSTIIGRVLVVEDELRIRRFVCNALGREGCETREAGNVPRGLALATSQHPDMIILDLGLPDSSGLDLIRNLRTWSHIPILILSARIAEQDKVTARRCRRLPHQALRCCRTAGAGARLAAQAAARIST